MDLVRTLLAKWDRIPARKLLWANLALGLLVGLSHGGALLAARAKPTPGAEEILSMVPYTLPLAALVALSAAFGLLQRTRELHMLAFHGLIFFVCALAELAWGVSLIVVGIPAVNFAWSVGLFTASIAYAVFLFSRYAVPVGLRSMPALYYAPVLAIGVAVPVDLGVFLRFTRDFF
jgi:hypothetical protein